MTTSSPLHPSVRERETARMTAVSLAQYLVVKSDIQDTVLHNSRFAQPPITGAYAEAWRALRTYNVDPLRKQETLERVKEALTVKSRSSAAKPKAKAEALRCIEVLNLFEQAENALGMKALPLIAAPRFRPLKVEGVALSVQPDFLIEAHSPKGPPRIGALILRLTKTPDPASARQDSTRAARGELRREMARYMVPMLEMVLKDQASSRGEIDRDLIFVADLRLGERLGAGKDYTARIKAITAGCRQIKSLWDHIEPRPAIRRKGSA